MRPVPIENFQKIFIDIQVRVLNENSLLVLMENYTDRSITDFMTQRAVGGMGAKKISRSE